jgi:hypothetical protein
MVARHRSSSQPSLPFVARTAVVATNGRVLAERRPARAVSLPLAAELPDLRVARSAPPHASGGGDFAVSRFRYAVEMFGACMMIVALLAVALFV